MPMYKLNYVKTLEKLGFQPRRELMNITSNLHVTIANLNKPSGWSDEELRGDKSQVQ